MTDIMCIHTGDITELSSQLSLDWIRQDSWRVPQGTQWETRVTEAVGEYHWTDAEKRQRDGPAGCGKCFANRPSVFFFFLFLLALNKPPQIETRLYLTFTFGLEETETKQ